MASLLIHYRRYFSHQAPVELALGTDKARLLEIIHYFCNHESNEKIIDGKQWTYNSYEKWRMHAPGISARTIRRKITELENEGLLISCQPNGHKGDMTKWYAINIEKVEELTPFWVAKYKIFCDEINNGTHKDKLAAPHKDKLAASLKTDHTQPLSTHIGNIKHIDFAPPESPNQDVDLLFNEFEERWKRFKKIQPKGSRQEAFDMWKKMKRNKKKDKQLDIEAIDKSLADLEVLHAHCKATGDFFENPHHFVRWLSNTNWTNDYSLPEPSPNGKTSPNGKKPYQRDSKAIAEEEDSLLYTNAVAIGRSLLPIETRKNDLIKVLEQVKNKTRRNIIQDMIDNLK